MALNRSGARVAAKNNLIGYGILSGVCLTVAFVAAEPPATANRVPLSAWLSQILLRDRQAEAPAPGPVPPSLHPSSDGLDPESSSPLIDAHSAT